MKKRKTQPLWVIAVVALLDDLAVVGLVFLILWALDVEFSPGLVVPIAVVGGAFVFIMHRAVEPSLRRRKLTGAEGMVGETAVVTEPLEPGGTVLIHGEYWRATSRDGHVAEGEEVEIMAVRRLNLDVKRKP